MSGDGLHIDQQAVADVAESLPISHGSSARQAAGSLSSGQIFGNSPGGRSLAEAWALTVDHYRTVTEKLDEDLVELRQALRGAAANVSDSESDSAARYRQAVGDFASTAEQSATGIDDSNQEFVVANDSQVALELAEQHGRGEQQTADGEDPTGPQDITTPAESGQEGDEVGPNQSYE